jgi:hypothetical protein
MRWGWHISEVFGKEVVKVEESVIYRPFASGGFYVSNVMSISDINLFPEEFNEYTYEEIKLIAML